MNYSWLAVLIHILHTSFKMIFIKKLKEVDFLLLKFVIIIRIGCFIHLIFYLLSLLLAIYTTLRVCLISFRDLRYPRRPLKLICISNKYFILLFSRLNFLFSWVYKSFWIGWLLWLNEFHLSRSKPGCDRDCLNAYSKEEIHLSHVMITKKVNWRWAWNEQPFASSAGMRDV